MRFTRIQLIFLSLLVFSFLFLSLNKSFAGNGNGSTTLPLAETDTDNYQLYSFFDLRDRESFVQVTNTGSAATVHVQVFDVSNLCNENNFNDAYTANDTHVYDMRDIQTNDGTGSGFELPDNAYGFVVVTVVLGQGQPADLNGSIIGNFRVIDNSGYEYRTNSQSPSLILSLEDGRVYTFNFNRVGDINFSDVVGITLNNITSNEVTTAGSSITFDTTLFNNNEVEFSCSDTTFSCTENTFECGINEAIPHSRDKGLICPSNNISEGFVRLEIISEQSIEAFAGYIGINTGNNSRGSMDSFHQQRGAIGCVFPGDGYPNPDAVDVSGHGPALSYTDNGDGTFTDEITGFMWEIKTDDDTIHDVDNTYGWSTNTLNPNGELFTLFLDTLNNKCDGDETTSCVTDADCTGIGNGLCGHAGFRDWRIPNVKELNSIVDYSDFFLASSVPGDEDTTDISKYWSATTDKEKDDFAWDVRFDFGLAGKALKSDEQLARAVRP